MKSENIGELAMALCKVQSQLEGAKMDSDNPFFKSKYADLRSVWESVRALLGKHDLSVVQVGVEAPSGHVAIQTTLMHKSGQWIDGVITLPSKKDNDPQQFGSAVTYARRYSLAAILGIYQEDDDANKASQPVRKPNKILERKATAKPKISPEFAEAKKTLMSLVGGDLNELEQKALIVHNKKAKDLTEMEVKELIVHIEGIE